MKLQLNKPFSDLSGKTVPDSNQGIFLSNLLANSPSQTPLKHLEQARKLAAAEELDLDKADAEGLRKFIEAAQIPAWASGQLLEALQEAKK